MVYFFGAAGVYMMLVISATRYLSTVYLWKPTISQQKLKLVQGVAYFLALVACYWAVMLFSIMQLNDARTVYRKFLADYFVSCFDSFPTVFMAIVYYKIGRALIKQNKCFKRVCLNAVKSRYV